MKSLMKYNIFESTHWGNLVNIMTQGYYSKVCEENDIDELIQDVKDVVLPLTDISTETDFDTSVYIKIKNNPSGAKSKTIPSSWVMSNISQITTDGLKFHTVKEFRIINYESSGVYSRFTEVRSLLNRATQNDIGWFGIDIIFKNALSNDESNKIQIINEYEEIKQNLLSRGWWINSRDWPEEYVFDTSNSFAFDIIRPISLKLANSIVPDLIAQTTIISDDKDETSNSI